MSVDLQIYEWAQTLASPAWLTLNKGITFFGGSLFVYPAGALVGPAGMLWGQGKEGG